MTPEVALSRDVVLVGGGHAHALALRHWAMHPMPGARLTVINPGPTPPYTGMLPGFIAGHYRRDEIEIDLFALCQAAGARLILGLVEGIDPATKTLRIADRPPVPYDIASFDIGVHSSLDALPGFVEHAVPAKPLARLSIAWSDYLNQRTEGDIAVLGGGLAGVELAMATHHRLKKEGLNGNVRVIERGHLLMGSDASLRRRLKSALQTRGIEIVENATVTDVLDDHLVLEDGTKLPAILTIGATGARPWEWLQTTALPLVDGFIEVDANLGVVGHDDLFAVGDCAHLSLSPRPKAGVYAVRAAPVLAANIEADLYKRTRRAFRPQRDFLKLVSLGGQSAIGHRGGWVAEGAWLWRLKDRIDRKFMARLSSVPHTQARSRARVPIAASANLTQSLCTACGGKVGAATLQSAISGTQGALRDDVRVPFGDDAAILGHENGNQVFTTDHIRAFDGDPRRVAIIAALHALGDVYAMGADPQAALAQITLPRLSPTLQMRWLSEINTAAGEIFAKAGATLAGGHTAMGSELIIGFSVTGLLKQTPITLAGALPGDRLVLTRPIGSGTVLRGAMERKTRGPDLAAVYRVLETPQFEVAQALRTANAMTDVTGFGLAGHAVKMAQSSGVGIVLNTHAIPFFKGARALAAAGVRSSLYPDNRQILPKVTGETPEIALLFDPQTAGGFLAAIPPDRPIPNGATDIGSITDGPPGVTLV